MLLQELGQVDAVLSFWELSQPLVSRLAEHLGLPCNPPSAVDIARDKQVRSGVPIDLAVVWEPDCQVALLVSALPPAHIQAYACVTPNFSYNYLF